MKPAEPPLPPPASVRRFGLLRQAQLLVDVGVLIGAFLLAYLLRFDFSIPGGPRTGSSSSSPGGAAAGQPALRHRHPFLRLALRRASRGGRLRPRGGISALPVIVLRFALPVAYQAFRVPLSVTCMDTFLAFGGLLAVRVLRRSLYERVERDTRSRGGGAAPRKPVLLVGAGRAGVLAVREIQGRGDMDIEPIGFVDDDPLKQGMVIHGVKVLGTTDDLPALARQLPVDHVILTIAQADPNHLRRIAEICRRERLRVRTIPGLYELLQGQVAISRFRDVRVEELLGRDPVRLDVGELERFLSDRRVLVTGAGGSIGSELARQIARFSPASLLLLDRAESALFEIDRELRALWPQLDPRPLVADVGDEGRLRRLFAEHRPEVVFHAAAHKHVPLMESHVGEAVRNNVLATRGLGKLAAEAGTEALVLISTDKAVRPTSVMGASKRLAELVIQDLDARYAGTRFLAVRFGNVMGSAGSVLEIFRRQIAEGGPLTVTHPEMTRYFMTIPEAAQLVLQAGAMGEGGEIFVLDMGEPVRIVDLARKMIALSGFAPGREIGIAFTGLRPGEKLAEELGLDDERIAKTRHPKIFIGKLSPYPAETVEQALTALATLVEAGDDGALRTLLSELIPESRLDSTRPTPPILVAGE